MRCSLAEFQPCDGNESHGLIYLQWCVPVIILSVIIFVVDLYILSYLLTSVNQVRWRRMNNEEQDHLTLRIRVTYYKTHILRAFWPSKC